MVRFSEYREAFFGLQADPQVAELQIKARKGLYKAAVTIVGLAVAAKMGLDAHGSNDSVDTVVSLLGGVIATGFGVSASGDFIDVNLSPYLLRQSSESEPAQNRP